MAKTRTFALGVGMAGGSIGVGGHHHCGGKRFSVVGGNRGDDEWSRLKDGRVSTLGWRQQLAEPVGGNMMKALLT